MPFMAADHSWRLQSSSHAIFHRSRYSHHRRPPQPDRPDPRDIGELAHAERPLAATFFEHVAEGGPFGQLGEVDDMSDASGRFNVPRNEPGMRVVRRSDDEDHLRPEGSVPRVAVRSLCSRKAQLQGLVSGGYGITRAGRRARDTMAKGKRPRSSARAATSETAITASPASSSR